MGLPLRRQKGRHGLTSASSRRYHGKMDPPPVHYATTRDGYNIAYAVSGQGRPLVFLPQPVNHIQLYWSDETTFVFPWFQLLARHFQLIQYDGRGQGMSSRGLPRPVTREEFQLDLETVLERLKVEHFILLANSWFGHLAIQFAANHPDRVDALILVSVPTEEGSYAPINLIAQAEQDWDAHLRSLAGLSRATDVSGSVERLKQVFTQPDYVAHLRGMAALPMPDVYRRVKAPTLVIHPRDSVSVPPQESMRLAAELPDASMILIDGATPLGDAEPAIRAIEEFLEELDVRRRPQSPLTLSQSPAASTTLSLREIEVLRLLAMGKSNAQIADELVISPNTVNRHVSNIYAKTGAANRAEAASYATRNGLA